MKLAHTTDEMHYAAELVPCPSCSTRDVGELEIEGSGTIWFLQGKCPRCGTKRTYRFTTAGEPKRYTDSPFELGPGPSELITGDQFLELYDHTPAVEDPTRLTANEWTSAVAVLTRALTCINELAKLLPPGADRVPGSDARLRRSWIEHEQATLEKLKDAYMAERPRINAAGKTATAATGSISDAAFRDHVQWLARGKSGAGRMVLEHQKLAGKRFASPRFKAARLVDCDLTGAVFGLTIFDEAELVRDVFARADLETSTFRAAKIEGGSFAGARLASTNWTGAHLSGVDVSNAELHKSVWQDAALIDVRLDGAALVNAILDRAAFERCSFRAALFASPAELPEPTSKGARFVDCDLRDVDWSGRRLDGTTFVRCKLSGARGKARSTAGVVVDNCDVAQVSFVGAITA